MDLIDINNDFYDDHNDQDDDDDNPLFDYYQNIARSSFDDMVNDQERNNLYYRAIRRSIEKLRSSDPKKVINVLDIGSGTGLLSMMAINAKADHVVACECFEPMAKCSKKIINDNSMSSKINVINQRSEFLQLPKNFQPNLLVAELLDTELIGECCLSIYRDLIKRKIVNPEHCLYVPTRARIWLQLVQSEQLFQCHQFRKSFPIDDDNVEAIETPMKVQNCFGSHLLHDIQLNRLRPDIDFEILSDPIVIFEFEFNRLESLKSRNHNRIELKLKRTFNQPMMLFVWWDIDLDEDGEICLSCGPYWTRGFNNEQQISWREHWIQTIYYLPAFAFDYQRQVNGFNHNQINKNQSLLIDCYHDQVSFWFDLPDQNESKLSSDESTKESECWYCTCGLHSHLSRIRLQWINNYERYQQYWLQLNRIIKINNFNNLILIYFGDESLLPFICSRHEYVQNVWIICNDCYSYRFFATFLQNDNNDNVKKIILCSHKNFLKNFIKTNNNNIGIISDLHFRNQQMIPSLEIHKQFNRQQEFFRKFFNEIKFFLPKRIVIRCLLAKFEHLWKCFTPVENVHIDYDDNPIEFNLSEYDSLIMNARKSVDWQFERRSLWEYCCWPLKTKIYDLFNLMINYENLSSSLYNEIDKTIDINIDDDILKSKIDENPNSIGIVCWTDYYLSNDNKISNGIIDDNLSLDKEIKWIRNQQQLVTFLSVNNSKWMMKERIQLKFQLNFNDNNNNKIKLKI